MGNVPSADKSALLQVKLKDLKMAIANGAKLLTFSSLRRRPNGQPYTDADLERARLAVSNLRAYTPEYHNKIASHVDIAHQAAVKEEEHQIHDLLHLTSNDDEQDSNHTTTNPVDKKCVRFADTEQVVVLEDPLPSLDQLPPMGPLKVLDRDINGSFGFELLVGNPEVGIRVFSVNDGSPAALKGVLVDSIIMQVDGVITYGLGYSEINDLLAKAGPFVSVRFGQQQVVNDADEDVANLKLQAYFKHVIHQKREREGIQVDPNLTQRLLEDSNEDEGGLLELSPLDSQSRRRKPKNFRKINASQLGSKAMASTKTTPRPNSAYGHSYVKKKKPTPKSAISSKLNNSPSSPHPSTPVHLSPMWTPPAHAPMSSSTPSRAQDNITYNTTPNTDTSSSSARASTTPPMSNSYTTPTDEGTPAAHATFDFDSATIYQPNYDNLDEYSVETDDNNTTSETEHHARHDDSSYDDGHHHEQEHSRQATTITTTTTAEGGLTPDVAPRKKRFDNTRYGAALETGVTMKVVGSKHHPQMMGNYREMEGQYNGTPVFCKLDKVTQDILYCLYYHDKSWRVSSAVGKKKCTISTTSPATRPDRAKSIWYEARGPNGHTMQGHPGISCKLHTSDGASEVGKGSRRVYVNRKLKLPQ